MGLPVVSHSAIGQVEVRTLALIPARAGSKSIPGKNRRLFDGVTLVHKAIRVALDAHCTRTVVSTDDPLIAADCRSWVTVLDRPANLAQDDTPMLAVVQHALAFDWGDCDVVVLLQPTQPLRTALHVRAALHLLEKTGADSVVSVVQIPAHYSPDYAMRMGYDITSDRNYLVPFLPLPERKETTRRQDARPAYSRDGTVYAIKRETIEQGSLYGSHCVPLVIPSNESVNLDTEEDWTRAEAMVRK